MTITTGQQALIRRIVTMTDKPGLSLPNGPQSPSLPRYVVQASGGGQNTLGLSKATQADPEIVVRVETADGQYATESDTLVSALVARFAIGDEFDGVKILDAPQVRAPILGDGVYAVPVIIMGRTFY